MLWFFVGDILKLYAMPLAAVGRMTLTNYLVQSLAFGLEFSGTASGSSAAGGRRLSSQRA